MNWKCFAGPTICALLAVAPLAAYAYSGQELASRAKLTMDQARSIALKAAPGKITKQELEKESGGSGLRYSFVIKRGAKAYEVGVDAQTGAILENKVEGPNAD
ncbi:MAG: PepSY domain-containing protein [Alphaproteobacteria bacterium]|nr:PepSY domain-containing protein [Alphaproteobacteria bacterium]MBV9154057.1 PepSY domain-containing protein [Alphaproteobacteria bacterium]MBV9585244.1 PepSY domain-containing protein [Alphaproteobacteria bacterium]MBV9965488.1 PepSY domain-containing protein [Alphaproteobacteria bacterium]